MTKEVLAVTLTQRIDIAADDLGATLEVMESTTTISKARVSDIPSIRRIVGEAWKELYSIKFSWQAVRDDIDNYLSDSSLEQMIKDERGIFLVASLAGVPVPCGVLYARRSDDGRSALLLYLYIDLQARGQRVGELLLSKFEAEAVAVERVVLDVFSGNPDAQRFYARMGYTPEGTSVSCIGELEGTWIRMAKSLRTPDR